MVFIWFCCFIILILNFFCVELSLVFRRVFLLEIFLILFVSNFILELKVVCFFVNLFCRIFILEFSFVVLVFCFIRFFWCCFFMEEIFIFRFLFFFLSLLLFVFCGIVVVCWCIFWIWIFVLLSLVLILFNLDFNFVNCCCSFWFFFIVELLVELRIVISFCKYLISDFNLIFVCWSLLIICCFLLDWILVVNIFRFFFLNFVIYFFSLFCSLDFFCSVWLYLDDLLVRFCFICLNVFFIFFMFFLRLFKVELIYFFFFMVDCKDILVVVFFFFNF